MTRTRIMVVAGTLALWSAAPADAQEAPADATVEEEQLGKLNLGLQTGVVLPQLQSELGTTVGVQAHVGYRVWRSLVPLLGASYAQPEVSNEMSDPRLPGDYSTSTTQRELALTLGAFWRFLPAHAKVNGYAGAGARVWLLETITNGESGGAEFLENRETSTRVGGAVFGGGELRLGPGAALLELDLGGSDLPHLITGDVATTSISLTVGYRVLLL